MQIAAIKPDFDKPNPKVGVSCIQFSYDNRFMFTRNGIFVDLKKKIFIIISVYFKRHNAEYTVDMEHG